MILGKKTRKKEFYCAGTAFVQGDSAGCSKLTLALSVDFSFVMERSFFMTGIRAEEKMVG